MTLLRNLLAFFVVFLPAACVTGLVGGFLEGPIPAPRLGYDLLVFSVHVIPLKQTPDRPIACYQRHVVNHAGGGDQFICGVALEVEPRGSAGYIEVDGKWVYRRSLDTRQGYECAGCGKKFWLSPICQHEVRHSHPIHIRAQGGEQEKSPC